jgi:hypothetical protein
VHQPGWLGIQRVQLDKLAIADFDEGFRGLAVFDEFKSLLEAQHLVKRARGRNVGNAKGNMRDAAQHRGLCPRKRGPKDSDPYDSLDH